MMNITYWLNGIKQSDEIEAGVMLLDFLRSKGCYSVKCGCETTNCGLCTVWIDEKPVLSCAVLAARIDGKQVTTLEGLQEEATEFAMYMGREGADQCGFCNPGFVMNVLAMARELEGPTEEDDGRGNQGIPGRQFVPLHGLRRPHAGDTRLFAG